MARVAIQMPEDFLLAVSTLLDKTDQIVPLVLEKGGNVVKNKVKTNLESVVGSNLKSRSRSTGELIDALGVTRAALDRNGNYNVKVGFVEPRSDGHSNAKIANVIEYGKSGQPPKPFLKPALSTSRKACIEAMKSTLEKEIQKITKE